MTQPTHPQPDRCPAVLWEDEDLPAMPPFAPNVRRAPRRELALNDREIKLAVANALRYLPVRFHAQMAGEFHQELIEHGRIYGYRFRPQEEIKARPIQEYRGASLAGKALQLMMDNNLDFAIALYPYELVTYGETGQVAQNWMQYRLIRRYLERLTDEQTLVIHSGHPLGLFPSHRTAPRVILTNGLMVGMFDTPREFRRAAALGVANYGQMTAGGWMYIGPQGIVHGTYNTIVIAGRLKLGLGPHETLGGRLFVSSGLGGMSGALGKAVEIAGCAGIIAEVDLSRIETRHQQGWVSRIATTPAAAFAAAAQAQKERRGLAVAFHGNIVDLLEYAVAQRIHIDLLSDQTSCHEAHDGGYCPQGISFAQRTELLARDRAGFAKLVDQSLRNHFICIQTLVQRGTYFFDYGNAFMKAVFDAGVREIAGNGQDEKDGFIFPSYVEDILGPELFDYGYGPFRWVCLSLDDADLKKTDETAARCISEMRRAARYQDQDNYNWVKNAESYRLVVGSKARILYQDAAGRTAIALAFNDMVRRGEVGPIMLGRDHHDTGGTDSPFRETSNIKDGSNVMADMATHCFAGNAARGMTLVALHNGGGVGVGKAINGGFGLLLDGSATTDAIIRCAMTWDVMGGVARRAWARNPHAVEVCQEYNENDAYAGWFTLPFVADDAILDALT